MEYYNPISMKLFRLNEKPSYHQSGAYMFLWELLSVYMVQEKIKYQIVLFLYRILTNMNNLYCSFFVYCLANMWLNLSISIINMLLVLL